MTTARSWFKDFPWAYGNELDTRWFGFNYTIPPYSGIGANEYVVESSTDGSSWKEVLRQPTPEHDQNNRAEHTLQLNDLRGSGHTVYVRLGDAFPSDGWGGWLARVKLVMERG